MSGDVVEWDLVNPEGAARSRTLQPAPRPASLAGKTVGLAWNGKPGGDEALDEISVRLRAMLGEVHFIRYWETLPESVSPRELELETLRTMAAPAPDLVIVAQAD